MKKLNRPTKLALIGLGVILVLAVVAVLWSNYSWAQYVTETDGRYDKATADIRHDLDSIESVSDLDSMVSTVSTAVEELCYTPILIGVRIQLVDQARQHLEQCQQQRQSLSHVASQAQQLIDRLEIEQQVSAILDKVDSELKKIEPTSYVAQQKLWQQTSGQLADIQPTGDYEAVMQAQRQAVDVIVKRYDSLIKADQAEKRTDFDDAAVELRDAYGQLAAAAEAASASYQDLAKALGDSVANL